MGQTGQLPLGMSLAAYIGVLPHDSMAICSTAYLNNLQHLWLSDVLVMIRGSGTGVTLKL